MNRFNRLTTSVMTIAVVLYMLVAFSLPVVEYFVAKKRIVNELRKHSESVAVAAGIFVGRDIFDRHEDILGREILYTAPAIQKLEAFCRYANVANVHFFSIDSSSGTAELLASSDKTLQNGKLSASTEQRLAAAVRSARSCVSAMLEDRDDIMEVYSFTDRTRSPSGKYYVASVELDPAYIESKTSGIKFMDYWTLLIILLAGLPVYFLYFFMQRNGRNLLDSKPAQLIHASRLSSMGEMTAGIAHEINQPLCVLRGYLELLNLELADSKLLKEKKLDDAFGISLKCVDKAAQIVKSMRNYARSGTVTRQPIDLKQPIYEAVSLMNAQLLNHNIILNMLVENHVPPVVMDPLCFEQIVVNLIANARYAVDKKGEQGRDSSWKKEIKTGLYFRESDNCVVFQVSDNGIGMSSDVLSHCRELFFTTKPENEGTGLGVAVVERLISDFGGKMSITSFSGEGTTFTLSFPAAPETEE